jgi:hypothetical protein
MYIGLSVRASTKKNILEIVTALFRPKKNKREETEK